MINPYGVPLLSAFLLAVALFGRTAVAGEPAASIAELRVNAELGKAKAQYSLGYRYAKGIGVPKDDVEALKWVSKAAQQGFADAQLSLGDVYAEGLGVAKDNAEAVKWYRKAADQGNARAQCNLGVVYSQGIGVAKDNVAAYQWFLLSGAQGLEAAKKGIDSVEHALTPEQRTEGQRLARGFKPVVTPTAK